MSLCVRERSVFAYNVWLKSVECDWYGLNDAHEWEAEEQQNTEGQILFE